MSIGLKRVPYAGGRKQGPNKWSEEVFGGGDYEETVREITQNSGDNPKSQDQPHPVRMKIESFEIDSTNIPGHSELLESFEYGLRYLKKSYPEDGVTCTRFQNGIDILSKDKVRVLRFSDYNTTGLFGAWDDVKSPVHRFFAAIGSSIEGGEGGGSRGHGKTAPFNLSSINTVFYSSYSEEQTVPQHTFYGCTDLIYFTKEAEKFNGEIFFCDYDEKNEYRAIIKENLDDARAHIPEWLLQREKEGTDIYIIGFEANDDNWENKLLKAYMRNFYAAIIDRRLEVDINGKCLDANSIQSKVFQSLFKETDKADQTLQYINAYINGFKETRNLPTLGRCSVAVIKKEGYTRRIDFMRSRKMKIEDKGKKSWSSFDYAAVFCCESKEGSEKLRSLEGSTHGKWNFEAIPDGKIIWSEIRNFTKEIVQLIAGTTDGFEEELNVADLITLGIGLTGSGANSGTDKPEGQETARKTPALGTTNLKKVVKSGTVIVTKDGIKKRKKTIQKPKKQPLNKVSNPASNGNKQTYRIANFSPVVVRNEKLNCFDVHVKNNASTQLSIQELKFDVPDENGASLGIKIVDKVEGPEGHSLLRKSDSANSFGPVRIQPGSNIIRVYTPELNVLLLIS